MNGLNNFDNSSVEGSLSKTSNSIQRALNLM
jgi:hypothetical protein